MTLAHLLPANRIMPELQAKERWEAISEIVDFLISGGAISPQHREPVMAALRQREETMSTGIGFGIAIPHASTDCVNEVVAAFARSTKGVEFEALDNELVHFVILFLVPKDQFQAHLRTLAAIAKFLNDRAVREQLAAAEGRDGILAVFQKYSGKN